MKSVTEALSLVEEFSRPLSIENRALQEAAFYYVATDLVAPVDLPPFHQSAMDGYALNRYAGKSYDIVGEVKAGDRPEVHLHPGEAARIFTGAALPPSADTVVRQEDVAVDRARMVLEKNPERGTNIRRQGEQVKAGEVALEQGSYLNPAAIGFLASLGIDRVEVYQKPSIAIVSTGNELIKGGQALSPGKCYESNSVMLRSALDSLHFHQVEVFHWKDHYEETVANLEELLSGFDMVLISGGISVGDYDYVARALEAVGVDNIVDRVRQKPGKPFYFGIKGETPVFGLPGNPGAALTCFYIYIRTYLERMIGNSDYQLHTSEARSIREFSKRKGKVQFCRAYYSGDTVEILEGQGSSGLQSFARSNSFVYLPEDIEWVAAGDRLKIIVLPVL
ncbi:molybdopterin molybdotransferase MoeA [Membranihabitans maritimus]|uniref:molybdopterin molybdotransferase MoeA n=1 Tax=Membranihabitans maritimus TaxID=2904244 RepID=UPI001F430516|nr:gephyrin-like molybdotransferase Glp [Membranihabitans maritimus]